jgi:hypothetical protein
MDAVLGGVLTVGGRAELAFGGVAEGPREPPRCGHFRFLVVKRDAEGANVLVLRFLDGQTALPVFGLEEEARMFLWLETVAEGWRVAEISEADLAALLRDSCARVQGVVHLFAEEGVGKGPATVNREEFLGALSGESSRRARETADVFAPRISAGKEGDFW